MGLKKTALLAALMALCAPAAAFDGTQAVFYVSIPLQRQPSDLTFGLRLQGGREHQAIDIDARMLHFLAAGGVEAKWILAGAVALGAAAAISSDRKAAQRAATAEQAPPCPQACK